MLKLNAYLTVLFQMTHTNEITDQTICFYTFILDNEIIKKTSYTTFLPQQVKTNKFKTYKLMTLQVDYTTVSFKLVQVYLLIHPHSKREHCSLRKLDYH